MHRIGVTNEEIMEKMGTEPEQAIRYALKRNRREKTLWDDQITSELLKNDTLIRKIYKLICKIWRELEMAKNGNLGWYVHSKREKRECEITLLELSK